MDPNETLKRLRKAVHDWLSEKAIDHDDADEIANLFDGLDEHLSRGGFPPDDWVRNQKPQEPKKYMGIYDSYPPTQEM